MPLAPQPFDPNRRNSLYVFLLIGAGILVLAGVVIGVLSTVFYRAYVSATPYRFSASVNGPFTILDDASAAIPYQTLSATDTVSKVVPATGSKQVEDHASGTITLYNAFSAKAQRLITNTRFATADGLIYRVHNSVVVPGYTMKAGLKVPGTVEVVVYADEAGEKYNIPLSDFTIPGLKGTDQYTLIYAKSKTPMQGGFVGARAVVDSKLRAETIDALHAELDRTLRAKVLASAPLGTLIFADTVSVSFSESPDKADGGNATIEVSGVASVPAVKASALAHAVAVGAQVAYDGDLAIENPQELSVHSTEGSATSGGQITLSIAGDAKLVADFSAEALARDLAGKSEKDITAVRATYPAIATMNVKVYPFWRRSIPSDASRVKVEIVSALDQKP